MVKSLRHLIFLMVLFYAGSAAWASAANSCAPGPFTFYSQKAISLNGMYEHTLRITSPDGKKILLVKPVKDSTDEEETDTSYTVKFADKTYTAQLYGFNGEVMWSPDSKAFAVTQTEGGGDFGSRVYVFYVNEQGMTKLDVSSPVEKDFGTPVQCEIPVLPNTGFISWKNDSSALLVAANVVHVSVCECMGTYRVYEINLPGLTIAKTYSQIEAKKRFWDSLGCELRSVDNSCVKTLESYYSRSTPSERARYIESPETVLPYWEDQPALTYLINKNGAKQIVGNLMDNYTAWESVMKHVASGQINWVKVALALRIGSDAGSTKDLDDAMFEALGKNPEYILRHTELEFHSDDKYDLDDVCSGTVDSATYQEGLADLNRVETAVRQVKSKDLQPKIKYCLDDLEAAKISLKHYFGQ